MRSDIHSDLRATALTASQRRSLSHKDASPTDSAVTLMPGSRSIVVALRYSFSTIWAHEPTELFMGKL